jgi:hypothetical protein
VHAFATEQTELVGSAKAAERRAASRAVAGRFRPPSLDRMSSFTSVGAWTRCSLDLVAPVRRKGIIDGKSSEGGSFDLTNTIAASGTLDSFRELLVSMLPPACARRDGPAAGWRCFRTNQTHRICWWIGVGVRNQWVQLNSEGRIRRVFDRRGNSGSADHGLDACSKRCSGSSRYERVASSIVLTNEAAFRGRRKEAVGHRTPASS